MVDQVGFFIAYLPGQGYRWDLAGPNEAAVWEAMAAASEERNTAANRQRALRFGWEIREMVAQPRNHANCAPQQNALTAGAKEE